MASDDIWHVGEAVFGSHSGHRPNRPTRTSITHPLQIATIEVGQDGGRIGITLCPGKKDATSAGGAWDRDLRADITVIKAWGASSTLCLLEPSEFALLSVRNLREAVRDAGMVFHHAPIPDVSVPGVAFDAAWKTLGPTILNDLREGRSIVVHCYRGLGRPCMIAAKLLVMMGEDPEQAIAQIRSVRPGAIETEAQETCIRS